MTLVERLIVSPPSGNLLQRFQGGLAANGKLYACGTIGYTNPTPHMTYDMIMDGATGEVLDFINQRENGQPSYFSTIAVVGPNGHIYSPTEVGTIIKWNTVTDTASTISTPTTTTWHSGCVAGTKIVWLSSAKAMILDTSDGDSISETSLYSSYHVPFYAPNGYVYAFSTTGSSVLKLDISTPAATMLTPRNSLWPANRGVFLTSAGIAYAVGLDGAVVKFNTNTDSSMTGFSVASVAAEVFGRGVIVDDHIYLTKWDAPYGDVLHINTSNDSYGLVGPGNAAPSEAVEVVTDNNGYAYVFRDNNPDIMQIDASDQSYTILPTAATAGISGQGIGYTGVKVDDKIYFVGRDTFFVVSLNASYAPPVACFTRDRAEGEAPMTVQFDASTAYGGTTDIANYSWDFDAPSGTDAGSSVMITTSHTYTDPGSYTVELEVTDEGGETDTISLPISVVAPSGTGWLQGAYWPYPTSVPNGATGIRKVRLHDVEVTGDASEVTMMISFAVIENTTVGYATITGAGADSWITDPSGAPRAIMVAPSTGPVDVDLVVSSNLTGDEFLSLVNLGSFGDKQPDSISLSGITWFWH